MGGNDRSVLLDSEIANGVEELRPLRVKEGVTEGFVCGADVVFRILDTSRDVEASVFVQIDAYFSLVNGKAADCGVAFHLRLEDG